ncbi:ribosome biogenesis protein [Rhizodiscina lignyota]|uniref:Ribosome biogenesis protein n=1 Tax=Rhizodiscina lignyota TaxID=1504668 RepID=A0A9P4MB88_9PEZI|nr:ribosome biogenesis protein [Rhizodiscina lignyota]
MSKRPADQSEDSPGALKSGERPLQENGEEALEFEDEFEDEFESEDDEILEAGVDGRPDEEREAEEREGAMDVDQDTFIPGRHKLAAGETLIADPSTYHMQHNLSSEWPCLSLDIIRDGLGDNRKSYPATMYAVAGTQAEVRREKENKLMVMKLSGLSRTDKDQEGSESESESEDEDADPILEHKAIPLSSTTNRIRAHQCPQASSSQPPTTLTASMLENGQVLIHDITSHLTSFDTPGTSIPPSANKPVSTMRAHKNVEGYALDWSPHQAHASGTLLTGDNSGSIFKTTRHEAGSFATDSTPYTGHAGSVEEIQWSRSEPNVFASCGTDGCVKIFDTRSKSKKPALSVQVSDTDVNVMSWSHLTDYLLASGQDDGEWAVWDLRQWKPSAANKTKGATASVANPKSTAVASFSFHKEQITCLEWHPTDDSIIMAASGDNTLTLWDLAVELDDEESRDTAGVQDVPPQLLFVHYMEGVKEGHWHPQIPGAVMATGSSGFGVFKTISV